MSNANQIAGATVYRWSDIPLEQMNPLFTRQFLTGEKAMLAKISLKQGCVVPVHHHPNEQISIILSGSLEFILDGVSQTVQAGDILVIPGNLPHSAIAHEDMEGLGHLRPAAPGLA